MRKFPVLMAVFLALACAAKLFSLETSAQSVEVAFKGTITENEEYYDWVCMGSYACNVWVHAVLYDPNGSLWVGAWCSVCYYEELGLEVGDRVEVNGTGWVGPACPIGFCGMIVCYSIQHIMLADLNYDCKMDMQDVAIAAKAFGSYPSHPSWNPDADINSDEKVNITDIALVAKDFGEIYP